jgi:hypothetical protein
MRKTASRSIFAIVCHKKYLQQSFEFLIFESSHSSEAARINQSILRQGCIHFIDTLQKSMSSISLVSIMTESQCFSTVDVCGCTDDKHYLPCQVATPSYNACPCCADICSNPPYGTCTRKRRSLAVTHYIQCRDHANLLVGARTSCCPTKGGALDMNSSKINSYAKCQLRNHNKAQTDIQ